MLGHLQRWDADEHYNDNMKTLSLHLMWFRHYRKVVWDEEAEEDLNDSGDVVKVTRPVKL
jgi:hypothetical protein